MRLEKAKEILGDISFCATHATDEELLLKEICNIFHRKGEFEFCLAGYVIERKHVKPIASVSDVAISNINTIDIPELKKEHTIVKSIKELSNGGIWKVLKDKEFRLVIILPIFLNNKPAYVLILASQTLESIDDEELKFIEEAITSIKLAIEKLRKEKDLFYLRYFDPLTGLGNRAFFEKLFEEEIELAKYREKKLIVIILDIENFSLINSAYGRAAGDLVLKEVAKRLQEFLKDTGIVARIGLDEFAIVKEYKEEKIFEELKQMENYIMKEIPFNQKSIRINISCGISLFPNNGETAKELILKAETALAVAKKKKERKIEFYEAEMSKRFSNRLDMERNIRKALEKKDFIIYYQPVVSTENMEIVGAEALIRWNNSKQGSIPPGAFIPVAEETGLIKDIDIYVFSKVSNDIQKWKKAGVKIPGRISINLTATNVKEILDLQIDTEIAKHITLEITEREILKALKNREYLEELKNNGYHISIDDFGTGYSSLNYLIEIPANYIKIDISFVRRLSESAKIRKLVRGIIDIASIFEIETIAEGVEKYEQLEILREMGCNKFQGFLFGPAVPVEKFEEMLK